MKFIELLERLREVDEVLLVELLELTSTDIVDAFLDRITEYEDRIRRALDEE
jgi:hypothetical protein